MSATNAEQLFFRHVTATQLTDHQPKIAARRYHLTVDGAFVISSKSLVFVGREVLLLLLFVHHNVVDTRVSSSVNAHQSSNDVCREHDRWRVVGLLHPRKVSPPANTLDEMLFLCGTRHSASSHVASSSYSSPHTSQRIDYLHRNG